MNLTDKQIEAALALPGDVLVTRCMQKIKDGTLTYDEMGYLCKLKQESENEESQLWRGSKD